MRHRLVWSILALLVLAGCEDVVDTVKGPMPFGAPDQRQTEHTFAADTHTTYEAAKAALRSMGLRYTHGGPAQGELDGISDVAGTDLPGSAHQYVLKAHLHPTLDGKGTIMDLEIMEVVEDDTLHHQGEGTESALRDPALYNAFFGYVQQQLGSAAGP